MQVSECSPTFQSTASLGFRWVEESVQNCLDQCYTKAVCGVLCPVVYHGSPVMVLDGPNPACFTCFCAPTHLIQWLHYLFKFCTSLLINPFTQIRCCGDKNKNKMQHSGPQGLGWDTHRCTFFLVDILDDSLRLLCSVTFWNLLDENRTEAPPCLTVASVSWSEILVFGYPLGFCGQAISFHQTPLLFKLSGKFN